MHLEADDLAHDLHTVSSGLLGLQLDWQFVDGSGWSERECRGGSSRMRSKPHNLVYEKQDKLVFPILIQRNALRPFSRATYLQPECRSAAPTSAQSHSEDSQTRQDMGYWAMAWADWGHGTTGMCGIEHRGARAVGGDRSRSQPAALTCRAGAHRTCLGGSSVGAANSAERRCQPADGVAMATALC